MNSPAPKAAQKRKLRASRHFRATIIWLRVLLNGTEIDTPEVSHDMGILEMSNDGRVIS